MFISTVIPIQQGIYIRLLLLSIMRINAAAAAAVVLSIEHHLKNNAFFAFVLLWKGGRENESGFRSDEK